LENVLGWEDEALRFIETNVFLYVITAHPEFGPAAKAIFERIEKGESALTSSLVVAEVCAWLEHHHLGDKMDAFFKALESYPSLKKCETTYVDEIKAQELESQYPHLEFFDRVYLAQMGRLQLTEIYSNDKGLDKVKEIKRIFK
jgi:predicted nucleic acid-binding protein